MSTTMVRKEDVQRKWYVLDAAGKPLPYGSPQKIFWKAAYKLWIHSMLLPAWCAAAWTIMI